MKINWNSKYFTIAVYATLSVVVSAVAIMLIFNFEKVSEKLTFFTTVATPLIIGVFCAYLLNPLMMKIENGLFGKWAGSESSKVRGRARAFALTITMLLVLAALLLMIVLVIPHCCDIQQYGQLYRDGAQLYHKDSGRLSAVGGISG